MDEGTIVLNSFKQNWQQACKDGWRIKKDTFYPPKEHEANKE